MMNVTSKGLSISPFLVIISIGVVLLIVSRASDSAGQTGPDINGARGKQLFERRCGGCHSLDADQTGPRLRNVYGRKAGSIPSFRYSTALRSAGFTWDDASLDKWLTDPDSLVPGNEMDFSVPKAEERTAIIRFLRLSSGK